jgi:heat shock protein HslJ
MKQTGQKEPVMSKTSLFILSGACVLAAACVPKSEDVAGNADEVVFKELGGTSWQLVEFQSMDDAQGVSKPADPSKYTITFGKDGRLSAQLDCNRGMGSWKNEISNATGGSLEIGPLGMTKMLCPPPSMGDRLASQLGYVRSFTIADGKLNMALMADGGIIVWKRIATPK